MRFLNDTGKIGVAIAIAAGMTMTAPALADNDHHDTHMSMTMHMDPMRDHAHHPAMRTEHRPRMPHHGMHWRAGDWSWQHDHWVWVAGIWIR